MDRAEDLGIARDDGLVIAGLAILTRETVDAHPARTGVDGAVDADYPVNRAVEVHRGKAGARRGLAEAEPLGALHTLAACSNTVWLRFFKLYR